MPDPLYPESHGYDAQDLGKRVQVVKTFIQITHVIPIPILDFLRWLTKCCSSI
jgi:hypothetical protein